MKITPFRGANLSRSTPFRVANLGEFGGDPGADLSHKHHERRDRGYKIILTHAGQRSTYESYPRTVLASLLHPALY